MSKTLYPISVMFENRPGVVMFETRPRVMNWRLPDQTVPASEELLNTDGETLLNTDGETLFNTGA